MWLCLRSVLALPEGMGDDQCTREACGDTVQTRRLCVRQERQEAVTPAKRRVFVNTTAARGGKDHGEGPQCTGSLGTKVTIKWASAVHA